MITSGTASDLYAQRWLTLYIFKWVGWVGGAGYWMMSLLPVWLTEWLITGGSEWEERATGIGLEWGRDGLSTDQSPWLTGSTWGSASLEDTASPQSDSHIHTHTHTHTEFMFVTIYSRQPHILITTTLSCRGGGGGSAMLDLMPPRVRARYWEELHTEKVLHCTFAAKWLVHILPSTPPPPSLLCDSSHLLLLLFYYSIMHPMLFSGYLLLLQEERHLSLPRTDTWKPTQSPPRQEASAPETAAHHQSLSLGSDRSAPSPILYLFIQTQQQHHL